MPHRKRVYYAVSPNGQIWIGPLGSARAAGAYCNPGWYVMFRRIETDTFAENYYRTDFERG